MKYFGQGLLTLLMGLFILSSCEKADTIGLDIDPQDTINGKFITDYNIQTVTVKDDSLLTDALSQYPLGDLQDPEIGHTEAGIALGLNLPSANFSFGKNASIDSAVLVLPYGRGFNGDSTLSRFTLSVSQLGEKYASGTYNTKKWKVSDAETDATTLNRFSWNDSIRVTEIVKGGRDTIRKVPPQLRVRLEKIKTILSSASASDLASNASFGTYFKGLYLKAKREGESMTGGVGFLNLVSGSAATQTARLDVYYKADNTSGGRDTSVATFAVGGATAAIAHSYNENVTSQLNAPGHTFQTVYVQPMGGLKTKISIPDLKKLKELGNIAVNKAELIVSVAGTNALTPAPALTIYQSDIAGQRQALPDQRSQWGGSFYNSTEKRYVFNISSYVQHILSGKTEQYPLFIISADPRYLTQGGANISPVATTAARAVLAGGNSLASKIKVNIYYTRLQ